MPLRLAAIALLTGLASLPAQAQDDHLTETDGLRVLHAWTQAGDDAPRIYMEIENESDSARTLYGARLASGATAALRGAPMEAEGDVVPLDALPIPGGQSLDLTPDTQYLSLDVPLDRSEGETLDMELVFDDPQEMDIHVEVLGPDADAHPHAGHQH